MINTVIWLFHYGYDSYGHWERDTVSGDLYLYALDKDKNYSPRTLYTRSVVRLPDDYAQFTGSAISAMVYQKNGINYEGHFCFVDTTSSTSLIFKGIIPSLGNGREAYLNFSRNNHTVMREDLAYIAYARDLQILDIKNLDAPSETGRVKTVGTSSGIVVRDKLAYIAGGGGLHVVEIGDPSAPSILGSYIVAITPNRARIASGIALSGNLAYLAYGDMVQVLDVSNPAVPVLRSECKTSSGARRLAIHGQYLYAVDVSYGLDAIDISNPDAIQLKSHSSIQFGANCLAFLTTKADPIACIGFNRGLSLRKVFPATGGEVGNYQTRAVYDIAINGELVYLAGENGLEIVDAQDPQAPQLLGSCPTPQPARGIALAEGMAYLAYHGGVAMVDIRQPAHPKLVSQYAGPVEWTFYDEIDDLKGITCADGQIYLADQFGLSILRYDPPRNGAKTGWVNYR